MLVRIRRPVSVRSGSVHGMDTKADRVLVKRQAWGTTLAATPTMKELHERVEGWLAEGLSEEEVRRRLCDEAVTAEYGLRAFLGVPRRVMRMTAADAVVAVAQSWAKALGPKKMGTVLTEWARTAGVDAWLTDWHIEWHRAGSPPPMHRTMLGGVGKTDVGPKGDTSPLVYVMAGPLSDPETLAEEFVNRCYREFPHSFDRKEHAERDAERVRRYQTESDFQIARDELEAEGWSVSAVGKREYNQGVSSRANSITQSRKRWLEYVTNSVEPVSPRNG